jgi:type II secretory pathway pseudopilin PulG
VHVSARRGVLGRARGTDGFTLIELLASLTAALVVSFAAFTLLDAATHQQARVADQLDATQRARTAMEHITQLLHSSCVASAVTPIQAGSDATHLTFISQFGSGTLLTPNEHTITFSGGNLTDLVYPETGGTAPTWTFAATASPPGGVNLLTNAVQAQTGSTPTTQPVFQYFAYSNGVLSTTPLATPLSSTDAASAAQVIVSFAAQPTSGNSQADRTLNLSDSVVLRLSPASGVTNSPNGPCQ